MDLGVEPDRLHQLDQDIDRLGTEKPDKVVHDIVDRYRTLSRAVRSSDPNDLPRWPLWQLVQDIQRQAAVYTNIIEQLKSGREASEVKVLFENTLGLIPTGTLPNPEVHAALEKAFKKVSRYATVMVVYMRDFGRELLAGELEFGAQHTTTLQVQVSFTSPSVTLGTEYTKVGPGQP